MSIEPLGNEAFLLRGLQKDMYANLDEEALYTGDENNNRDAARDMRGKWDLANGWDTYIDKDGAHKPWFHGFDYPEPERRITAENEAALEQEFFEYRVMKSASATPEGAWLVANNLWKPEFAASYKRDGSIRVQLDSEEDSGRFHREFASA